MGPNTNSKIGSSSATDTSTTTNVPRPCPYHTRVLTMGTTGKTKDLHPMDRFLAEGPAEQSSLFIRSDTEELSTKKGCTCTSKPGTT